MIGAIVSWDCVKEALPRSKMRLWISLKVALREV